ncbi:hypothetical protein EKO04_011334 [Ascochyta lentis]|uniref:RNase III domain-containing protein n=1 Tax=Ascochyta lentis TaxID=205686 RepID=A0A8H7IVC6_9PLEO|nr:hypothetical protein EKO04_011334 [Ascochyta lentis]
MNVNHQITDMERIVGHTFQNRQLAVECLYHGGQYIFFDGVLQKPARNERLAIVGDKILDVVLGTKWYYSRDAQGVPRPKVQWNVMIRDDLVANVNLSIRGRRYGLDICVIKDTGTSSVSPDMMATTLEAVIGAVFLDTGANTLDTVRAVMSNLGLFEHPLLLVTLKNSPPLYYKDIQMITKVQYLDTS